MKIFPKAISWIVGIALLTTLGFRWGDDYFEISKNLDIFGKLYREINTRYVEDTDPERLMRTGINAMLNSLDPYTNFIDESEIEDFHFMSTGQYGGIGALVGKREDRIMILEPYQGYPADLAGIEAGDQLLAIEGKNISSGLSVTDVRNLLRGEKGTELVIQVDRQGEEMSFRLTRERIRVNNVSYSGKINDHIGYIALEGFTLDAGKEVRNQVLEMKKEDPQLQGIILDLRGNPGGRLDEAVNVSNVFLPANEKIVETRGRSETSRSVYLARKAPADTELPLVVLIDRTSASASEIVAGAIQDLDRGVIVGQRSFGKGLVQNIRPLSYGTQLKITTAKYYTPSGRCIQAVDYNRNPQSWSRQIPDSLRATFTTRAGRTVKDGGGIEPDVAIPLTETPDIVEALIGQGLIFDYATQYKTHHSQIESPEAFALNGTDFQQFSQWLNRQEFQFETEAEKRLNTLEAALEAEGKLEAVRASLQQLRSKITAQTQTDLTQYQLQITELIEEEIASRYYYKPGMIRATFDSDPEIIQAVDILNSPQRYQDLLAGK